MGTVDYTRELSVLEGKHALRELDDLIAKPLETKPDKKFYIALAITLSMTGLLVVGLALTFYYGIGMWGNNIPVGWAFDIVNFVFWVGIGHAGTLISAIYFCSDNAQIRFAHHLIRLQFCGGVSQDNLAGLNYVTTVRDGKRH